MSSEPAFSTPAALCATQCPLCGEGNRCAMELERTSGVKQPPCWCTEVDFSAALLARVPQEAQRRACICRRCATATP